MAPRATFDTVICLHQTRNEQVTATSAEFVHMNPRILPDCLRYAEFALTNSCRTLLAHIKEDVSKVVTPTKNCLTNGNGKSHSL